jgi:cytochrome o ubiquinol oxidase subunit 1
MFGKLTIEALPFYSPIAAGGAAVTVGGALLVAIVLTWLKAWKYLWTDWLTSVDHKRIGIMYVVLALIMLLRGFVDALMMRAPAGDGTERRRLPSARAFRPDLQHARQHHDFLHVAMPFMSPDIMNYIMPLQIGARDVSFPLAQRRSACGSAPPAPHW